MPSKLMDASPSLRSRRGTIETDVQPNALLIELEAIGGFKSKKRGSGLGLGARQVQELMSVGAPIRDLSSAGCEQSPHHRVRGTVGSLDLAL
jgi:hypothetical protein